MGEGGYGEDLLRRNRKTDSVSKRELTRTTCAHAPAASSELVFHSIAFRFRSSHCLSSVDASATERKRRALEVQRACMAAFQKRSERSALAFNLAHVGADMEPTTAAPAPAPPGAGPAPAPAAIGAAPAPPSPAAVSSTLAHTQALSGDAESGVMAVGVACEARGREGRERIRDLQQRRKVRTFTAAS